MAGESGVKAGDHVWGNTGGKDFIGHVQEGEHENNAGELKATVQVPGGGTEELGYREPADRDDDGAGGTFWLV